jgi:hypothetical protein
MGFVLKKLTDDEREQMGFARTASNISNIDRRRGMDYVGVISINRKENAYILSIFKGATKWGMEFHWQNKTILIVTKATRKSRESEKDKSHKIDVYFEIQEMLIPEALQDKFEEIKNLLKKALEAYAWGSLKYNGIGYVEFSPLLQFRFPKIIKSKVKLSDFASIN